MKKLLALLIVCFMLLAFVGCKVEVNVDPNDEEASSTDDVSSNVSSGLTSDELDDWWNNAEIEIEGGSSDSTSSDSTSSDSASSNSTSSDNTLENPTTDNNDDFNDYVPTEKDENFGAWI